jgi:thiamine monophosphate synthase
VLAAGADAVAVISALCAAPDPEGATRAFLERIAADR